MASSLKLAAIACLVLFLFSAGGHALAQFWPFTNGRLASVDGRWLAPVASRTLSSDENDHLARNSVYAWDVSAPFGSTVYPMAAGAVTYAGCNNAGGYGCWALIDHKDGYTSLYAHLIDEGGGNVWVQTGDKVGVWTPLGRVGWTGQTSFGPHVHWEIHHNTDGRVRIEHYFQRGGMAYCKFCASSDKEVDGGLGHVFSTRTVSYYTSWFTSQYLIVLLVLAVVLAGLVRPGTSVRLVRRLGRWFLLGVRASGQGMQKFRRSFAWPVTSLTLLIFMPSLLCGSTLGVGVWMADEGVTPRQLSYFLRFGFYTHTGTGYQSGLQYSAVWGVPCRQSGSLGRACTVEELVGVGQRWQEDVYEFTGVRPVMVMIPRINSLFGYPKMRTLLRAVHDRGGLVIVDVEGDLRKAYTVIDELAYFGLDGIAIDIEFTENLTTANLRRLALYLAEKRSEAGLAGDGVLVVWDVFHNIQVDEKLAVDGVRIVPIFTGYGSTVTKIAGLQATQRLFDVEPVDSGLMAFDSRWPINYACRNSGTRFGFDCQHWRALFATPKARSTGWWVQQ